MSDETNKLSIEYDDDNKDYFALNQFLEEDTNRRKNKLVFDIEENGERYLKEIDRKKKVKHQAKTKYIPYILKHSLYDEEELLSYSFEDVMDIYKEIKYKNRPWIIKFFDSLFGV